MSTAIWWIRRDLRITDNQALTDALDQAAQVIPTFILDPALLHGPSASEKRTAFLFAALRDLDASLRQRGSHLIVRSGDPLTQLTRLQGETNARAIVAETDYSPYARRRDAGIAAELPLRLVGGSSVYAPQAVLKGDGEPYVVFTPFSKAWKAQPRPGGEHIAPTPPVILTPGELHSERIPDAPTLAASVPFPASEHEAQRRLAAFIDGNAPPVFRYGDERNRMDLDGTSQLSPYLRFGILSPRQAAVAAYAAMAAAPDDAARKSAESWLNELIWREFYISILYHFPHVLKMAFRPDLRAIPWANDPAHFASWKAGRTGYPVVDAAMRQLLATGWMHNRARMIVASFLVKDLLIDWRWGERWFMQHLVDGDPASNNGGWQWTAGTGTDAAPYFRIFNPVSQGQKFDPEGAYVRRWVPELAAVPAQYVHSPWEMPEAEQRRAGCRIGHEYPRPIVDHALARERTLAAYAQARQT